MTTKKYNHIHKLRRDRYSTGRSFYYCVNDCSFKVDVKHSLGKTVLCNKCNKPFVMNEYSIRSAKPKCFDCVKRKESTSSAVNLDSIISFGVKNANIVDRNEPTTRNTAEVSANPITEIQNKFNVLVREYNPETDDDDL